MELTPERAALTYADVYQKLYNRPPRDLHVLDQDWVMVNGARMRVTELEYLTTQLEIEYRKALSHKKSIVSRLINWFK
ncbi:MAG: hypothetical protein SF162_02175 [bacterium]|nr:hypothetical protein [bacterium]